MRAFLDGQRRPTPTRKWWTACWRRRATPSSRRCTGSTPCAMPTPAASTATIRFPAWPYRDYVLHAFRDNKPFDEFTREQLAGDLLPNATVEQRVASAYNRLNRTSAEGGLQPKEYLAKYGADRVRTAERGLAGQHAWAAPSATTTSSIRSLPSDFYSMKAFFADIKETGLVPDRGAKAWGAQARSCRREEQKRQRDGAGHAGSPRRRARLDERTATLAAVDERVGEQICWRDRRRASWRGRCAAPDRRALAERRDADHLQRGAGREQLLPRRQLDERHEAGRRTGRRERAESGQRDLHRHAASRARARGRRSGIEVVQDESLPGIRVCARRRSVRAQRNRGQLSTPAAARKLPFAMATVNDAPIVAVEQRRCHAAARRDRRRPEDRLGRSASTRRAIRFSRCASRSRCRPPRSRRIVGDACVTTRNSAARRSAASGWRSRPMRTRGRRSPTPAGGAAEIPMAAVPGRAACRRMC